MKMYYFKILLHLLGIFVLSHGLPSSLMEDIKDAQVHSSMRSNKVKRAQEFIMFGNQQNRATNSFGNTRNEKRASGLGDNSLIDEDETLPKILPQVEEEGYQSNQLGSGGGDSERAPYSQIHDLYYNLLLRNLELGQQGGMNMDVSPYTYMEGRPKRDTGKSKTALPAKTSFRMKREYALNPEDLLAVMSLWESEKANRKYHDQRPNYFHWPSYDLDADDDDDSVLGGENDDNGMWYDGPIQTSEGRERESVWPRPHKRFMVSKRQYLGDGFSRNGAYDYAPERLHRRLLL